MQKEITTPGAAGRGLSFCILLHTVPQLETGLGAGKTELGSGVTYAAAKLESQSVVERQHSRSILHHLVLFQSLGVGDFLGSEK